MRLRPHQMLSKYPPAMTRPTPRFHGPTGATRTQLQAGKRAARSSCHRPRREGARPKISLRAGWFVHKRNFTFLPNLFSHFYSSPAENPGYCRAFLRLREQCLLPSEREQHVISSSRSQSQHLPTRKPSPGPRTEAGKAKSPKNARRSASLR